MCLDVRRRNCGIDGKPMMFYSPPTADCAHCQSGAQRSRSPKKANGDNYGPLDRGLEVAWASLSPPPKWQARSRKSSPTEWAIWLKGRFCGPFSCILKRKDSADSVGR